MLHNAIVLYQRIIHVQSYSVDQSEEPLYCTSALYTFSRTVWTNQSSVVEPYLDVHPEGCGGRGGGGSGGGGGAPGVGVHYVGSV